jgi:hypothetical protein
MAVTLSVFTQFFFFTEGIPRGFLAGVSAVLFAHVIVGTHMLLGLIDALHPLGWYGGEPLKSTAGRITIAGTAALLLARNVPDIWNWETLDSPDRKWPIMKTVADLFEFWTLYRFDTTERFFKSLEYIAGYLGFGFFWTVFVLRLQKSTALEGGILRLENWINYISETALPCLLILMFGIILAMGRQSIRLELKYGPKLFPAGREPKNWGGPKDRVVVILSVLGFLVAFVMLTWFAENIRAASFIMLVLACNDWRTRYLIQMGIKEYWNIMPEPEDKDYEIVRARRKVAKVFLYKQPHLWKETAKIAGCLLAFIIGMSGVFSDTTAYIVLLTTLVLNEVLTLRWRMAMFFQMREIDLRAARG